MMSLGLVLALSASAGAWEAWRTRALGVLTLGTCALAITALYAAVLPAIGHGGRYQPLNVMLFAALAAAGGCGVGEYFGLKRTLLTGAALVLVIALATGAQWRGILHAGIIHIETTHHAMGRWLRDRLPEGARVAAFDIGAIGYEIGPRLTDLSGLADPSVVKYLRARTVAGYLQDAKIEHVVLPSDNPRSRSASDILGLRAPGLRLDAVHSETAPQKIWTCTWESTYAAWPAQTLYRLVWLDGVRTNEP
jgi:hypothetical protein